MADHETPSGFSEIWTAANRTRSLALSDYIRLIVSVLAATFGSAAISRNGREAINRLPPHAAPNDQSMQS
jgi:hypothetical protein